MLKMKKLKRILAIICVVSMLATSNFSQGFGLTAKAEENTAEETLPTGFTTVTPKDLGFVDGATEEKTYNSLKPLTTMDGVIFNADVKFTANGQWMGLYKGQWATFKLGLNADDFWVHNDSMFTNKPEGWTATNIVLDPAKALGEGIATFKNQEFNLKITTEIVNHDQGDTDDDVKIGLWFNDKLYSNEYIYIKDGLSQLANNCYFLNGVYVTSPVKPLEQLPTDFKWITWSSYNKLTDGTVSESLYQNKAFTSFDKTLFSVDFKFDSDGGKQGILYGTGTNDYSSLWSGPIEIYASGGGLYFRVNLGTKVSIKGESSNSFTFNYKTSGITTNTGTFFDELINIKITTEYLADGTGDVKVGIWFNDILYNDKYIVLTAPATNASVTGRGTGAESYFGDCIRTYCTNATWEAYSDYRPLPEGFRQISLNQFGFADGMRANGDYKKHETLTSLDRTIFSADFVFDQNGDKFTYALGANLGNSTGWAGPFMILCTGTKLNFTIANHSTTGITIKDKYQSDGVTPLTEFTFDTSKTVALINNRVNMKITTEFLHNEANDVRIGIWFNNVLYNDEYIILTSTAANADGDTGAAAFFDTGIRFWSSLECYSEKYQLPENTNMISLTDMNVAEGKYAYNAGGLASDSKGEAAGTSMNGTAFSARVRFQGDQAKLFYGCQTDTYERGIYIYNGTSQIYVQQNYAEVTATTIVAMSAQTAGFNLVNNTFDLQISTRFVDIDGDEDGFDDVEIGVWIKELHEDAYRLYANTYYYVADIAEAMSARMSVYAKTANSSLILGDYTQETPDEIEWCLDNGAAYFAGETMYDQSGTYLVKTTEGNSTFKKNVTIYKSNDITADTDVNVKDLVRMKKVGDSTTSEATINELTAAGKKAIGYVENAWTPELATEALTSIREEIIAFPSPVKVFDETLVGETGGNAVITDVANTENGTAVLSMSDIEGSTYSSNLAEIDTWGLDYVLDFDEERKGGIKVLQLTDTQIINWTNKRDIPSRAGEMPKWEEDKLDANLFNEMDALVENTKPDLILITGDIVYGEFDDEQEGKTSSLEKFIAKMDGYQIPWAPIFGNHDNESNIGVIQQCKWFMEAKYCLFNRRHEIGGNGNYSIGLSVNGTLQRTIFMMDSNGCSNLAGRDGAPLNDADKAAIKTSFGFTEEQTAWYKTTARNADENVPSFLCAHIPTPEFAAAAIENGYLPDTSDANAFKNATYTSGIDGVEVGNVTDTFGFKQKNNFGGYGLFVYQDLQVAGTDGVFVGHQHLEALSVMYEGIRFTFGLKTGQYDEFPKTSEGNPATGGTLITVEGSKFGAEHIYGNQPLVQ